MQLDGNVQIHSFYPYSLTFVILLTSPQGGECYLSMSTEASSFLPDELAEVDHGLHLVEADSEGVGHGPEPGRIDDDIPIFERRPLRGLHAGQLSGLFDGMGCKLPDILDHDAEQPAPGDVRPSVGSEAKEA